MVTGDYAVSRKKAGFLQIPPRETLPYRRRRRREVNSSVEMSGVGEPMYLAEEDFGVPGQ
jgi:hypothetical protein